jgi:hypothetical protein
VPTTALLPANVSQIFSVPGRTALLNGYDNQTDIAFALRPFVEEVQEMAVRFGMALMFPSDDAEIAERNRKLSEGTVDV